MINVMVRACLTQEIKHISNLIEVKNKEKRMSEIEIKPKAELIRKPNLTECRMFRSSEVWIEHTTW